MRMILFDFELINVRARRMRHRLTPDRTDQAREEAERSATSPPMDCYPVDCFAEPEQERCCTCNQRSIIIPSSTDHRFCARASAQPFTDRSPIPSTKQASTNQVVEPSLEIRAIFSTTLVLYFQPPRSASRWPACPVEAVKSCTRRRRTPHHTPTRHEHAACGSLHAALCIRRAERALHDRDREGCRDHDHERPRPPPRRL